MTGPQMFMHTTICTDPEHGCKTFRVPPLMDLAEDGTMQPHELMTGPGQSWTWMNDQCMLARSNLMDALMDPRYRNAHGMTLLQQVAASSCFDMPPLQFTFINTRMTSGHNTAVRVPSGDGKT